MRIRRSTLITTLVVTVAALGPLLVRGGLALRGDMVFVPDQPWKPAWLGLTGGVPRAVPMDALISLVDEAIPGALLQRVLLVAAFLLGGFGIARLAGRFGAPAQAAAVIVYLWNPWVLERLSIGQWPMVLGYGLLPWVVLASVRLRDARPGGWPDTLLVLILSAICAPSFGLIGALVSVVVVLGARSWRRTLGVFGLALLANLPWVVPALLGPGLRGDGAQFGEFAARGESTLGTFASLVSMGGIWKSAVVPAERTEPLVVVAAGLLAIAFMIGFRYAAVVLGRPTTLALGVVGGVSLVLALAPTIGPIGRGLGSLSADWGAVGILRDSQRYLAPLGLVLAIGAAALVERLIAGARAGKPGLGASAFLLLVAPVVFLPSLFWGLTGDLRPVDYPGDWDRVASRIEHADGAEGALVVLPWTGSYRGYAWNDDRAMLDPADRLLPGDVFTDDRLFLRDRVLLGEDPYLGDIGAALESADPSARLRGLGVRWVLTEKDNGVQEAEIPEGAVAFDGRWLSLTDLGAPERRVADLRESPSATAVVAADSAVLFALCVSFWQLWRRIMRNQHNRL